jgi:hypothetical protein
MAYTQARSMKGSREEIGSVFLDKPFNQQEHLIRKLSKAREDRSKELSCKTPILGGDLSLGNI